MNLPRFCSFGVLFCRVAPPAVLYRFYLYITRAPFLGLSLLAEVGKILSHAISVIHQPFQSRGSSYSKSKNSVRQASRKSQPQERSTSAGKCQKSHKHGRNWKNLTADKVQNFVLRAVAVLSS